MTRSLSSFVQLESFGLTAGLETRSKVYCFQALLERKLTGLRAYQRHKKPVSSSDPLPIFLLLAFRQIL